MMNGTATPPPSEPVRGTFDGLEKLFFDRARAIELGEMTAPPEVMGAPQTLAGKLQAGWCCLALHQKVAMVSGTLLLTAAALIMF